MRIDDHGPRLSEDAVLRLEAELGARLPKDYRELLLLTNGGRPRPDVVDVPGFDGSPVDVQTLFGIGRTIDSSCIDWNRDLLVDRLDAGEIPIACTSTGDAFALAVGGPRVGAVDFLDLTAVWGDYGVRAPHFAVAPSFAAFLGLLRELRHDEC